MIKMYKTHHDSENVYSMATGTVSPSINLRPQMSLTKMMRHRFSSARKIASTTCKTEIPSFSTRHKSFVTKTDEKQKIYSATCFQSVEIQLLFLITFPSGQEYFPFIYFIFISSVKPVGCSHICFLSFHWNSCFSYTEADGERVHKYVQICIHITKEERELDSFASRGNKEIS